MLTTSLNGPEGLPELTLLGSSGFELSTRLDSGLISRLNAFWIAFDVRPVSAYLLLYFSWIHKYGDRADTAQKTSEIEIRVLLLRSELTNYSRLGSNQVSDTLSGY